MSAPLIGISRTPTLSIQGISGSSGVVFEVKGDPALLCKNFREDAVEALSEYYYSSVLHAKFPRWYFKPVSFEYNRTCTLTIPKIRGINGIDWMVKLSTTQIRHLMVQFLTRLNNIQQLGLTHYDISPGNVMLQPTLLNPAGYALYLIDFGRMGFNCYHITGIDAPGYVRAPELIFKEVSQGSQPMADLWGFGLTCLRLFFNSLELQGVFDQRHTETYSLDKDMKIFGKEWVQTAHLVRKLMSCGMDQVTAGNPEDLTQIWHVLTSCLRIPPEERGSVAGHRALLEKRSFHSLQLWSKPISLSLPDVSLVYDQAAFYYNHVLWLDKKPLDLKADFPHYDLFISHLPLVRESVGILAASVNLYLVYCVKARLTTPTLVHAPTKKFVTGIVSVISHLVYRTVLQTEKHHYRPVETELVRHLDWALLYKPFQVGKYRSTDCFPNKKVAKQHFDLATYLKQPLTEK